MSSEKIPPAPERFHTNLLGLTEYFISVYNEKVVKGKYKVPIPLHFLKGGKNMYLFPEIMKEETYNESKEKLLYKNYQDYVDTVTRDFQYNLIGEFCQKTHLYWDHIKERNRDFIMNNLNVILGDSPNLLIDPTVILVIFQYKDQNGNLLFQDDFYDDMWGYLTSIVKICIKHIHEQREPQKTDKGFVYTKAFLPEIKVSEYIEKFSIKL